MVALAAANQPVLLALACDVAVPCDLRVRALEAALRGTQPADAQLVEAIGVLLAEVERGAAEATLVVVVAEALAVVPSERAQAVLVGLLEWEDESVKLAAVKALGVVGTVESVRALMPLRDRFMAFASALTIAARDAILAIQARAGNSEAGALAIAESESGLAVVDEG